MKHQNSVTRFALCLVFVLAIPLAAHAQIIFSDSFENDAGANPPATPYTGYNLPTTTSTPAWNFNADTGVANTTPSDSHFDDPNGGIVLITNTAQAPITGINGNYYMTINNSGGNGDDDAPPFTDRTPSAQTDTITTVNGSTASGQPGVFAANTTYTLSVLMAMNNGNTELTGIFSLLDGTTSATLNSFSLAATSATDSNFDTYSLTFDTGANPSVVGDNIQIALEAAQTANEKFNPDVAFDNVVLTAAMDVPEPSSWALMFGGLLALASFRFRSTFKRA